MFGFFGQVCCLSALFCLALGSDPYIWPLPQNYSVSETLSETLSSSFRIVIEGVAWNNSILSSAVDRYYALTFPHRPESNTSSGTELSQLTIKVDSANDILEYGIDESYSFSLPSEPGSNTATINAKTVYGALRGLETFSQTVIYNFTGGYYQAYSSKIYDFARFKYRGMLIDTSRHFQSVDSIKDVLLAMSYAKFNTLHWHIIDDQSFPYESKAYPKLWKAAYNVYERYSQNDVIDIVQFAKNLGIRVIPEFDMPGHASSWCKGYPDICPSSSCEKTLNPAANETWEMINGLIKEAGSMFFDNYIHLGGDEVSTECWSKTESVQAWMTANNFTANQALQYFEERAQGIAYYTHNKNVIVWDDVFRAFYDTLDSAVVTIEVYKNKTILPQAVKAGFHGILANYDKWYLPQLEVTWDAMYGNEPYENITDASQQALILGGEACMWGETVDVSDIEQTIWPRAAAVAERLWSDRNVTDVAAALPRIEYFRCLLNQRGIAAAPVNNAEAREAPTGPGSCYDQRR